MKAIGRSKLSFDLRNGVRPPAGLDVKNPLCRLGAPVSLPVSLGKVTLVSKPDRSLSLRYLRLHATAGETFLHVELKVCDQGPMALHHSGRGSPSCPKGTPPKDLKTWSPGGSARRLDDRAELAVGWSDGLASRVKESPFPSRQHDAAPGSPRPRLTKPSKKLTDRTKCKQQQ